MINLAEGHKMPNKPVYWMVWILDPNTKKPFSTRGTYNKYQDPVAASKEMTGIEPTPNMIFFNLGSTATGMRKMVTAIRRSGLWERKGGR